MRKKTAKVKGFICGLHDFITQHDRYRKNTSGKSETQIQTEIRPLIIDYLEQWFANEGYKDAEAKANRSFYWEGQEGTYQGYRERDKVFNTWNYPDFIVEHPYRLAIEFKQSPNGSLVKQGLGQCLVHTLSGDFDFAYLLFHDQSRKRLIFKASQKEAEQQIVQKMWRHFNVMVKFT